ncbi:neuroblast differentiation-associated protein AHNAK [Notothenia coriiceps]|uniref:Neuroblast differentiation-associated protein AHNAK n=1 Tax=Notothenia coriiceps TaxID=8208 RepID=A0A6I9MW72_9TELE|nr:PREDICTED: neuroblast differentiation-associated protein AHNAK [Notothenia coriiceps]
MAEEEETREVLFQDWEGPDKSGFTIEQTGGEIFVGEVKGESPAARSGKVYEGDQIVGATVYFDNMSSEETAELLKTLNRHKVGLKLQNKGDKSPCCSPLSTPCRSPIGTLTWEGKTRFGGSSPDIILGGEDEDYKRIYTKKIKPRLKSEDLAEGVDVRTERHSSTSSDGSTITTVTRRITTYTVDMPGGISEQLELSSPEFKGLRQESGDGSSHTIISHGSPAGKVGAEGNVFDSSNVSYTGPQVGSIETRWGTGGVQTTRTSGEVEGLRFKGSNFGGSGSQGGSEISSRSGEQVDGGMQVLGTSMTVRDSANTDKHVAIGGFGGGDENGGLTNLSSPGKSVTISTSSMFKTQEGSVDTSLDEKKKLKLSEISYPQAKGSGRLDNSNVRLEGGSICVDKELSDGRIGGSAIQKGKITSGFSSGPGKISMAGRDVDLTGSKFKGELDAELPSTKVQIPSLSGPNKDVNLRGSKVEGNIDVTVTEGGIKTDNIDIKSPTFNIKEKEGDSKMPRIKISSFGVKGTKVDAKTSGVDIEGAEIDGGKSDVKVEGAKIKIQSFGFTGQKVEASDVDVKLAKPEIDFRVPEVDVNASKVNVKSPYVDINASKVDIDYEGPRGGFNQSKCTMPTIGMKSQELEAPKIKGNVDVSVPKIFGLKGPKLEGPDVDVDLPKANIVVKAHGVDIKGPQVDIAGPKGGFERPKIKMTSFGLKGPKVEGPDVDVNLPKGNIDLKGPGVDIKGPQVEMPKFKIPSFGVKTPNVEGSEGDVTLSKVDIEMKAPDMDVKGPDFDDKSTSGKIGGPAFKLPSISGPKIPDVDLHLKGPKVKGDVDVSSSKVEGDIFDINLKGPKIKGDVNVSVPKISTDIQRPEVKIKGPGVDIEGPKGRFEMPKPKMPSFGLKGTKVEGPDVDVNLPKADFHVKAPEVDIGGPKVHIEGVDVDGQKGTFKMPKIQMPSFGLKGSKVEGPDIAIKLPKAEIDVKGPEVDLKGLDVNVEGPDAKLKGTNIKLSSSSGPKIPMPDVDFNLKSPKLKGDVDMSMPKTKGDLNRPEVDIKCPDVDIEGTKSGFKMPNIKMPSWNIKGSKCEGPEVDINLPEANIDVKTPDVDITGPAVDFEGPKGGFEMPKIKMPSFGLKGPKVEGPDININLPKADIDVKAPHLDIKGPDVDIESPSGKIKGHKFKMPTISGPNLSMPNVDFNLKGPKLKGDVDMSMPKIKGDIKRPEVEIKAPAVDIEGLKGGIKMPKIQIPSFGFEGPKVEVPDVDINLPRADIDVKAPKVDINLRGPTIKGDVGVSVPKIEGDIEKPAVDIKGPQVDFKVPKGGFTMPTMTMPSLNIKDPKVEGSAFNINIPKGNIDVKAPDVDFKVKGQKVKGKIDASLPKLDSDIKGPTITMEGVSIDSEKTGITFPKFKGPKFGMKSPEVEGKTLMYSVEAKGSKTELPGSDTGLDAPDININVKGKKGKFKLPKVKGKAKKPEGDIETPAVDLDVDTPNIQVKGTKVKKPRFGKLHFPDVELDMKSPKLKGDGSLPEGIDSPNIHLGGTDMQFKTPNIKMPNVNVASDVDTHLNREATMSVGFKGPNRNVSSGAELDASASGRSGSGALHYPEGTVTFPKIKVPQFGIIQPQEEVQGGEGSWQVSSPNIEVPSPELRQREGKIRVKMPTFFGKSKAKGSSAGDLRGPEVGLSTSGKGGKVHTGGLTAGKLEFEGDPGLSVSAKGKSASLDLFKKSRHRSSSLSDEGGPAVSSPSAHLEAEGGDISLDLGESKVKGKKGKLKFGTFGGFGAKSKGSYEVSLGGEGEAGAGVSLPSKTSRLSSSSSSDSGSRGGFRFPRLELSVSPKK